MAALLGGTLTQLAQDRGISLTDLQKLNPQANLNTTYSVTELKFPTISPTLTPAPNYNPPAPAPSPTPTYSGPSIVDYLASTGKASDFASRSTLAGQYGITNYTGTAEQNTLLLNKLRSGSAPVPPPPAPIVPPPTNNNLPPPPAPAPTPYVPPGGSYDASTNRTSAPSVGSSAYNATTDKVAADKAAIDAINAKAQADQDAALNAILNNTSKVDLSSSVELTKKLTSMMEDVTKNAPAKPQSLAELFTAKKTELGITPLETDLANIDTKIKQLDANFANAQAEEDNKLISTREISRNLSQTEVAYNRQRRDLLLEKDAVSTQLTNKMNTLEMVMNFTQNDFTNASNYYNQEFNKNLQFINLISNLQEREQNIQDKVKTEARANLTMIQNLAKDHQMTFNDTQKAQIKQLELAAGVPQGFTELITKAAANMEIKGTSSRTDAQGNEYYDVLMVDPKTNAMTIKSIFRGVGKPNQTEQQTKVQLSNQMTALLKSKAGSDGHVSPDTWNALRQGWIAETADAKSFDENFAQFINQDHAGDYFTAQ